MPVPQRPNVLIVTTDQQRVDSLSCYCSTFLRTPHLDRLAREGVLVERAYCANAPDQASLTGRLLEPLESLEPRPHVLG